MIKNEKAKEFHGKAEENTIERILDMLITPVPQKTDSEVDDKAQDSMTRTREIFRKKLLDGKLEDREIEIDAPQSQSPIIEIFSPMGMEELGVNFQEMFSGMVPKKTKLRKMSIKEARRFTYNEEISKLINMDDVIPEALERVQESGIIFIDEIDKIVGDSSKTGPDVSREGVQRDILPIIEGCGVSTKYGLIRTDHILFIAAGAFHVAAPSDLIPELQGRFPIRVELDSLTAEDFERILTEPKTSLVKQYQALLKTEKVELIFLEKAVKKIAEYAERVNMESENIGARRLHTVLTTLLEDILFSPPVRKKSVTITAEMVEKSLDEIIENEDLSKYIL
jgi:ATP-dependent HslUV protease ATP-binding subunit HslU